jgi:hypothetical protein
MAGIVWSGVGVSSTYYGDSATPHRSCPQRPQIITKNFDISPLVGRPSPHHHSATSRRRANHSPNSKRPPTVNISNPSGPANKMADTFKDAPFQAVQVDSLVSRVAPPWTPPLIVMSGLGGSERNNGGLRKNVVVMRRSS